MTLKTGLFCILFSLFGHASAQTLVSAGIFTGFTIPLTNDKGINIDPRYQTRYDIKWVPIGFDLGIDFEGYGFLTNPSVVSIGQNFYMANTVGGQVGNRKINLTYLQLPIGMKLHLIDLSFFRVSLAGSVGASLLLKGSETISHESSKMWFPDEVKSSLPPEYIVEYDGVIVPDIHDQEIVSQNNFKPIQFFGSLGIRSDWDVSEKMRVSFDLRGNLYFADARNKSFVTQVKNFEQVYDIYGRRTDIFVSFTVGVSRIHELKKTGSKFKKYKKSTPTKTRQPKN